MGKGVTFCQFNHAIPNMANQFCSERRRVHLGAPGINEPQLRCGFYILRIVLFGAPRCALLRNFVRVLRYDVICADYSLFVQVAFYNVIFTGHDF